jgi:hypothetical protein
MFLEIHNNMVDGVKMAKPRISLSLRKEEYFEKYVIAVNLHGPTQDADQLHVS